MNDEDAADAIQDTILTCWEKHQGEQPVELSIGRPVPVITDGWSRGWGPLGRE